MSALATMVIADALGTPVNHNFVWAGQRDGIMNWQDQASADNPLGVPDGFSHILASSSTVLKGAGQGKFSFDYRFSKPTLEVVSNSTTSGILPAAQKAYDCAMFIKVVFPARSSLQNRLDLAKMGILGFQNAQLSDWYTTYQQPY